jgi:uncharacterized protein (DUF1015 family)
MTPLAAPPYDVIDEEDRGALEAADPHNAVRLILPRAANGDDPYRTARDTFDEWRASGVLDVDDSPRFYGCRMQYRYDGVDRHTVGVIGALGIGDPSTAGAGEPEEHGVLPHERTMHKAKSDRLALLRATRANLDPIWGLSLADGLSRLVPAEPIVATAVDAAGTRYELVPIDDPSTIDAIRAAVRGAPLVLADGHHRYETARNYRAEEPDAPGVDAIMALVVELCDDELCVRPIHRLVSGLGSAALRELLAPSCETRDAGPNTPEGVEQLVDDMEREHALGIVDRDGLALAIPRPEVLAAAVRDEPGPVRDLDATRFEAILLPALGDAEVSYRDDAATVAALVGKGSADAAVLLRPVTVEEIRAVAFAGERMPQKTTFFYPKPRTGMVFRSLDD